MPEQMIDAERQEIAERVAALRQILPPIHRNAFDAIGEFDSRVTIDCEWNPKTGALELIGVGNARLIVQLWWDELDQWDRMHAAGAVIYLVRRVPVLYHNADADIRKLREHGIMLNVGMHRQLDDTMLAHAVLHCEEDHDLGYVATQYGKLPPYKGLKLIDPEVYNACDLLEPGFIWTALEAEFALDPAAERIYRDERLAKLPYIIRDEERGIRVDRPRVFPMRDKFDQRRKQAQALAEASCGWPIKLSSPDDMKVWLYDIEQFPVQRKKAAFGDVGVTTTDKDAIATLRRSVGTEWDADDEPTLDRALSNLDDGGHPLLEARYLFFGAQQAISHYIDPCIVFEGERIAGIRDRIYPETRQHVQTSGRDSITGPAMQQLKGELELLVLPDTGTGWIGFDWSNIETWIIGVLAGDSLLLEAKTHGWDTHTLNFCTISGTPRPPIVTKALHTNPSCAEWREHLKWQGEGDQRRVFSKRFVYRVHYRGKPELAGDIPGAKSLGFDARRLVEASERYLGEHHWIPEWWAKVDHDIDRYGVVYTFRGTPRRLTSEFRNAKRREGCNHLIQGAVANIYNETRLAIHHAAPWLEFVYGKHDSQWWQSPLERMAEARAVIAEIATRPYEINGTTIDFPASFKERVNA